MKRRICFTATVEIAVKAFLVEYIKAMTLNWDVTVVTTTDSIGFLRPLGIDVPVVPVRIERQISPGRDLITLFSLYRLFRRESFDIIHSITPKAGLLSMIAGRLARVPVRIHTFTGQVWATRRGFMRFILKTADMITALFATHILVDSHSQRDFLIREKIISADESHVIGNGSMCGVDLKRFSFDAVVRDEIRQRFLIGDSDIVFLFLGRLTMDKGLLDLARSFSRLCETRQDAHLIIVGPDEEDLKDRISSVCETCLDRLHFEDYTHTPEKFMAASDIFCLPSYREGFGAVIIEAAAVGIPSIGTRIYGLTDAIENGVTGFLYEAGNVDELYAGMLQLLNDPALRNKLGENARERAARDFSKDRIVSGMIEFYRNISETEQRGSKNTR